MEILQINAQQFPEIAVTVSAGNLEGTLVQLTPMLRHFRAVQAMMTDATETVGTDVAFVINAEQFDQRDALGGTYYDNMVYVMLSLVQREFLVRQQDRLAAFAIDESSGLDLLQDWTDEPNLLFNQLAQNMPDTVMAERSIIDGLWQVLEQFPDDTATPTTRSIILFSVDTNVVTTERPTTEALIAKANEHNVHVYIVELTAVELTATAEVSGTDTLLQQLAAGTEGLYLRLQSSAQIDALGARLAEQRQQRTLTYRSNAPYLDQIAVALQLSDGTEIEDSRHLGRLALPTTSNGVSTDTSAPLEVADPSSNQSTTTVSDRQSANAQTLVSIPGTSVSLPLRTTLVIIGLLVMLLAYLLIEEIRQRRMRADYALAKFKSDSANTQANDTANQLLGAESNGAPDGGSGNRRSILPMRRNGFQNGATPHLDYDDDEALTEVAFEDEWLALPSYARTESNIGHLSAEDDEFLDAVERQSFDADDRTMGTITYI